MKELVIASANQGKIDEIRSLLRGVELRTLRDIGFTEEIGEPYHTFEENALAKANAIHEFSGQNVLSDDSGLCVNVLNGAPGVQSAFLGGLPRSDQKNNDKLLELLKGAEDRSAQYKAVICLIWEGQTYFFEGLCTGRIAEASSGSHGFGYDPLFIPDGYDRSFGELPQEVKNELSHRGKAIRKMAAFLNEFLTSL